MKDFSFRGTTLHNAKRKENVTAVTATINLLGRNVTYTVDVDGFYDLRLIEEKETLCIIAKTIIQDKALSTNQVTISNCCGYDVIENSDICSKCKEHSKRIKRDY